MVFLYFTIELPCKDSDYATAGGIIKQIDLGFNV